MSDEVNSRSSDFESLIRSLAMEKAFYRVKYGQPFLFKQDMGSVNFLNITTNKDDIQLNDNAVPNFRALYTFVCIFDCLTEENREKLRLQQEKSVKLGLLVDFVLVDMESGIYENLSGGKMTDRKLQAALEKALKLQKSEGNQINEVTRQALRNAGQAETIMGPVRRLSLSSPVMILVIINVAVFFIGSYLQYITGRDPFIEWGILNSAKVRECELWRLFTAMFLHADPAHLFGNMYFLIMLGRALNNQYSNKRLTCVYLISGVAGCTLSFLFAGVNSLGASGAIMGLGGVLLCKLFFDENRRYYRYRKIYANLAILVVFNLLYGLFNTGIDNFGHFGGFICGFLMELYFQHIKSKKQA